MRILGKSAMNFLRKNVWMGFALTYLIAALLPGSLWQNPGQLEVADTRQGEEIHLLFDGGPIRPFFGSYTVTLRDFSGGGVVCEASGGPINYVPGSQYPETITMEWWAPSDRRCWNPPVGTYSLETCWEVHGPLWGLVPSKRVCAPRAAFTVAPAE